MKQIKALDIRSKNPISNGVCLYQNYDFSNEKDYMSLVKFRSYPLCFLLFLIIRSNAQRTNTFKSEISFSSANDAYVIWQNSDRFYSYGVGLNLKVKKEKLFGLQKYFSKKEDYFFDIGLRIE
ncbi:hypothetical protein [uncultured Maribacter sp.]|uniref:hypothetical protein n=1 Tax=uncultured Maribacter sp. TaxID=431308 RepID=UPI0026308423|nr:hypothetical protein [uncultured Maribacter sp.]